MEQKVAPPAPAMELSIQARSAPTANTRNTMQWFVTATVSVDTRQAGPCAALAPADQPDQQVPPVLLHRQRPAGVALPVLVFSARSTLNLIQFQPESSKHYLTIILHSVHLFTQTST